MPNPRFLTSVLLLSLVGCSDTPVDDTDPSTEAELADADSDGFSVETDCDDTNAAINPDADERCNDVDDDCDGVIDNDAVDQAFWYADTDSDGFGDAVTVVVACEAPTGFQTDNTDCDDSNIEVHPNADERCNDVDDNCDGVVDTDAVDRLSWFVDADYDRFGDPNALVLACVAPNGTRADNTDCDDTNAAVRPDAEERCNGLDDNCDSVIDTDAVDRQVWYADADDDGFGDPARETLACDGMAAVVADNTDCDDGEPAVNPASAERCNGIDDNCDTFTDTDAIDRVAYYPDADDDGFGAPGPSTLACDLPANMSADDTDCDDGTPAVNPMAAERCNGLDDNCDRRVDEGIPTDGAGCAEPDSPVFPATVSTLQVAIRTGPNEFNGTGGAAEVCLGSGFCFLLNHTKWNDREPGVVDVYTIENVDLPRAAFDSFTLAQTSNGTDQWRPSCVQVVFDGELMYCNDTLTHRFGNESNDDGMRWEDPDGLAVSCQTCFDDALTHGPIVGATTPDSARLWWRTSVTERTAIRIGTSEDALEDASPVAIRYPPASTDHTAVAHIQGLSASTTYHYDVEVNGVRQGPWSFQTPRGSDVPGHTRLAFGSCSRFDEQPIFSALLDYDPDLFLFVGDNHYGNTAELGDLRQFYRWAHERPFRAEFMQTRSILATWDDHDYVDNNTDGNASGRESALRVFREYWANPSSGIPGTDGTFFQHSFGDVDIFMLDTRYWRGRDGTMLGAVQHAWLIDALRTSDAPFKLVASGTQVNASSHGDAWNAYPNSRDDLLEDIAEYGVDGVVVLAGDIHRSELRTIAGADGGYDVPELSSSPLANHSSGGCSTGDDLSFCYNDGASFIGLEIDTTLANPTLTVTVFDEQGSPLGDNNWVIGADDLTVP